MIGTAIKQRMRERGISNNRLKTALSDHNLIVATRTIDNWINNRTEPRASDIAAIALVLDVTPQYFFDQSVN